MRSQELFTILDACVKLLKEQQLHEAEEKIRQGKELLASEAFGHKIDKVTELNYSLIEVKKYVKYISNLLDTLKSENPKLDFYGFEQQLLKFKLQVHDLRHEKRKISKS